MVKSLDFRAFALRASGLYSTEASERAISESFKTLPRLFPNLVCLLLDGHPELDPGSLATATSDSPSLELLDLARCRQELTPKLFGSQFFRSLVYLDVSYVPGSLKSAILSSLNPTQLPELRLLKAQGREVDDVTAQLLFQTFKLQLWSIDLSNNKLTDNAIDAMLQHCFSSVSYRSDARFEVEGKVIFSNFGSREYGPFEFIHESENSGSFSHPERYLADPPVYTRRSDQTELQEWQTVRSDGSHPLRGDDAGIVKELLLEDSISATTGTPRRLAHNLHLPRGGITHLYLNGNNFTSTGIGRLLRHSSGRLEHFECDHCFHVPPIPTEEKSQQQLHVDGLLGLSHLFRPVLSSNLRSLRAHHSLVTQVPKIVAEGLSFETSLRVSEAIISNNVGRVYPQRFTPDMNPRIASLTLTNIPTRSTGPIIERLTSFLDLASSQQKSIKRARSGMGDRHPSMLVGLRHIRLELDPDFSDGVSGSSTVRDINYDKLLDPGDGDFDSDTFSFFHDAKQRTSKRHGPARGTSIQDSADANTESYAHWTSGRLRSPPFSDTESHFIHHHVEASKSWTGNVYSVPVWIGPGIIGPHPAVNEYMWNLQNPNLRLHVGPATPSHVAAGVPALTYIFYAAWDAMIFPKSLATAVARCGSAPIRDVATAIKDYRLSTKGTSDHWDGKIELVRIN